MHQIITLWKMIMMTTMTFASEGQLMFSPLSIVQSHNETIEFCKNVTRYNDYSVYRPLTDLLASRNAYLNQVMNNQPHTPLY